jgi:hypothetical protein
MARYDIGRHAKTTAVKRSLARRERDVEVSEAFLLKIERGVLRRAKRTDALFKRAGMEEYHVPRVVEDSVRRLSVEIRQLPQSGRRLTRLRRDEVETVLALIRKLVRRQARLEVLLANESVWRRQLKQKLATTDAILPLLHAGNLDQLEELLAQRRGKPAPIERLKRSGGYVLRNIPMVRNISARSATSAGHEYERRGRMATKDELQELRAELATLTEKVSSARTRTEG